MRIATPTCARSLPWQRPARGYCYASSSRADPSACRESTRPKSSGGLQRTGRCCRREASLRWTTTARTRAVLLVRASVVERSDGRQADLERRVARKFVHRGEGNWNVVHRQGLAHKVLQFVIRWNRLARWDFDRGERHLAQPLVGHAHHTGVTHRGMLDQYAPNGFRHDFEPAAVDGAGRPALRRSEPVGIASGEFV